MRVLCLLILACALSAGAQANDDVRAELDACLAELSAVPVKDFEAISSLCGSLRPALENSAYAAWLPQDWWQPPLNYSALEDFARLVDDLESTADAQGPDAALLAPILDEIRQAEISRQQSFFQRVRAWLRKRLESAEQEEERPAWFRWIEQISRHQTALEILSYVLLFLVVGLAVGIVIMELKAAGVFERRARDKAPRGRLAAGAPAGGGSLADLDAIDPVLRPSHLLERVLAALAGSQRGRVDRAQTHRELRQTVRFEDAAQVQRFETLARCAERVRYSPSPPPRDDIDRAVSSGRELLAALESKA